MAMGTITPFQTMISRLDALISIATPGDQPEEGEPTRLKNGNIEIWGNKVDENLLEPMKLFVSALGVKVDRAWVPGLGWAARMIITKESATWIEKAAKATGLCFRPE